ncbi:hypothetical protein TNCV_431191 [Trichonephila clavipes]|nr:hypothetical protein TNCV_431191 [Trichonephila clavipes]
MGSSITRCHATGQRFKHPEQGKAESAFHPLSESINESQASLKTVHWGFSVRLTTDPNKCPCISFPKVMKTEMCTVGCTTKLRKYNTKANGDGLCYFEQWFHDEDDI